ncbi:phage tail tape measure protein [Microbacterium sp. zg-YB36]|uniref:phage tail tape measure protein n=1 Tax=Microbacterium sp. zg-YB36 TaxID=2969407 RepID=UPI00214B3616|nr:phage tail tape measure protein [Microbacterium sp. zg-YB36]MDL5351103.1 phage tail tape measure protein [Microbacterium sp. zg-YB36]
MDNLNARAELEVIVTGLDKAVAQFESLYESTGDKQWDKYGRTVARVSGQIKGAGAEASTAGGQLRGLAGGADEANAKNKELESTLPRLRYALYDVASTATVAAGALTAAGVAVGVLSASFESSFTSVERTSRTSGLAAENLRGQLMQLTREIPTSFGEVSQIATLGAQLNIAAGDLASFSESIAQFSATAGTTLDATATGFGRIAQLLGVPTSEFNKLGSAILYAGNTSVATEQDVLNYAQRLSIVGNEVGLTADQVVALSATLSSLGIGLEASQGATQRVFQQITRDVSEGGDALQNYAAISGMAAEDFASAWNSPDGPQGAISALLKGLSQTGDLTAALDALGIVETREVRLFTALANNVEFYNEQLASTNQAYQEGTYLAGSYGLVVDDLASKWQIFVNALSEAGAAVGDVLAPAIKVALDFLAQLFQGFAALAANPVGSWVIGIAAALGGIVAILAAVVAAGALTIASMAALRTAMVSLNITSAASIFTFRGLSAAIGSVGTSMGLTTAGVHAFKVALASTGIGLVVVALGTLAAAFMATGNSAENAFNTYVSSTAGLSDALAADRATYTQAMVEGNFALANSFVAMTPSVDTNSASLADNATAISNTATVLGLTPPAIGNANDAIQTNTQYLGENTNAWVRNQLMQNEAFRNLAGNAEFTDYWTTIGANMDEVIRASAAGGEDAVLDYFQRLENAARVGGAKFQSAFAAGGTGPIDAGWGSGRADAIGQGAGAFGSVIGRTVNEMSRITGGFINQVDILGVTGQSAAQKIETANEGATESYSDLGGGAAAATQKVRTLADYASDLQSVFSRSFDIRFGGDQAFDTISTGWSAIAKAAEEAREEAAGYRAELADMAADRNIKKYWLMVAENYGDTLRAGKLRAELAELDQKQTGTQKKLTAAQDKSNKTLEGNSDAAIANRAEILGLVGNYQNYLQALAASGMEQAELERESQRLRAEFVNQAAQMGYNRSEIERYAAAFDDMGTIIRNIPRDVTIDFDGNAALTAIEEFKAKAQAALNSGGGLSVPVSTFGDTTGAKESLQAEIIAMRGRLASAYAAAGGNSNIGTTRLEDALKKLLDSYSQLGFRSGGYTGNGGVNDVAGLVHGKEFVMSAPAVRNAGGPNAMAYMHNMLKSGKGFAPSGLAASGSGMVELSPYDRQLLSDIRDNVGISIPGQTLQAVTNGANANATARRAG